MIYESSKLVWISEIWPKNKNEAMEYFWSFYAQS